VLEGAARNLDLQVEDGRAEAGGRKVSAEVEACCEWVEDGGLDLVEVGLCQ